MDIQTPSLYNIFIFFLIISSNYLGELFPCRIQKMLSSNMLFKHIFGFLTLSFFVVLTDNSKVHTLTDILFNSLKLYSIFLIFINNNLNFFMISLFIVAVIYIINIKINEITDTIKTDTEDKNKNENSKTLQLLHQINKILSIIFIIIIIIGFLIYMGEKKVEYKSKFSYITFIFGKEACRGKSPNVDMFKAIKTICLKTS